MRYVLALDQGTTSSRAILFDEEGTSVSAAQRELRQIYPQPGWVEHDPREIWSTQRDVARRAVKKAGIDPRRIAAIGLTNQRETTVLWDRRSGAPLHNAIVWQDRRTATHCQALKDQGAGEPIRSLTGLVLDPYFSATKLAWMLDQAPDLRRRAERGEIAFGTVDSWLAWNLSGGKLHITDPSNASRTMLYDIHRGEWSEELLRIFRVPREVLPQVMPSSHIYGETDAIVPGAKLPIAGIAGDQQAALFGQGCHHAGTAKNTYGTGCFLMLNTGTQAIASKNGLLTTLAAYLGEPHRQADTRQFALEGSVFTGGAVVQWLRDGLGLIRKSAEVEKLAASVPDSGGVYVVPAFTGLGAPHWDPYARGTILGLTRGSGAGHIARAALESIAFQSAELLRAMQQDAALGLTELRVDGGAAANNLLMQFQADLLGIPVVRPRTLETTALGVAYLAGLATGVWNSLQSINAHWQEQARFLPSLSRDEAAMRMAEWSRALGRSAGWAEPARVNAR